MNSKKINKKYKKKKSRKKKANINVGFMRFNNTNSNNLNENVNILNKKMVSETKFGGYPLDLLFGIIYLKRKHPTTLALPFDIKQLLIKYSEQLEERVPFTFIGCIIYKCHENIIQKDLYSNNNSQKKKYKFNKNDFEIELPGKASISEFKKILNSSRKKGRRFTIIPLIFRWSCNYVFEGHANIMIFDFETNTVERFEPYGFISSFTDEEEAVSKSFNDEFKKLLNKIDPSLNFIDQFDLLRKGPQFIEEIQVHKQKILKQTNDPEGFCGAWSLWYADLRLTNPNKSPKELIAIAIDSITKTKRKKLRAFIRNYSLFLVEERYNFLKKIKQKNPYNHVLGDQIQSLKEKKTTIAGLLKTSKILEGNLNK